MNWILLSLISAVFESGKDAYGKLSSQKTNEFTSAMALHLVSLIMSVGYLIIFDSIPPLSGSFWVGTIAFLFITPAWSILYMKALKLTELSISLPMMAFNPIFTALLNAYFKDGRISVYGWVGIISISVGIYFVNIKKETVKRILEPLRSMFQDKGAISMLGVAALWSFGAHFSKMRVEGSSPAFSTLTGAIIGVASAYMMGLYKRQNLSLSEFYKNIRYLAPVGLFYYLATFISSIALREGATTYVFALKRGSIISSALLGKIFFGEQFSKYKYIGLAFTALGIFLLAVG